MSEPTSPRSDLRGADLVAYQALERSLTNHKPDPLTVELIEQLRDAAKHYGACLLALAPASRERSLAVTHLEDSTMWAVKALILGETDAHTKHLGLDRTD